MGELDETSSVAYQPANKSKIRKLWIIALIMAVITAIEFVFATVLPRGPLLYFTFVALTIVKAFYIVAEFMHLKGEVKTLIWSIIIPLVFVVWLIIALLAEGASIFELKF
ncbi:cytochrome C oxidase subunit IV family protein [Catalinimonas niigatensis]|uniref:cytochrome C oxidase subunit IV family protein n=1 Tax=Catalinimonas niigatensis TaxID=1397264 RepID=UPI002666C8FE|nr:cytochrome C oxidase subunit IV family protein [Catalinimonas niigatensis]WPP51507.1 cytochrome C oxidase subunit IV family protein [Catalinimonas niigatensis]